MTSSDAASGPLCAQWTREHQVDPVGTIGSYRCFLLVEWPLPWPRDIGDIPDLQPLVEKVARAEGRLQALVPKNEDDARRTRSSSAPARIPSFATSVPR